MRRSVIEGKVSTYVSLCDREITLRWQKASATSITCTLLPAILRSLKAILKCFRKGNFSLPQWSEVLSRWLVKDIYLCCDSWPKIAPILLLFLLLSFYFSPISLCPAIHVFMFSLCANSVMNFSRVLNSQLFASWHNMKGRTTAADRDASFIFINQTTVEDGGRGRRGAGEEGGSDTCRKSWIKQTSCHFKTLFHTHTCTNIQIASYFCVTHHCLKLLGMTSNHLMFSEKKLSFEITWKLNPRKHENTHFVEYFHTIKEPQNVFDYSLPHCASYRCRKVCTNDIMQFLTVMFWV